MFYTQFGSSNSPAQYTAMIAEFDRYRRQQKLAEAQNQQDPSPSRLAAFLRDLFGGQHTADKPETAVTAR